MFSVPIGTVLWSSISFLIVLFILAKYAWKPILQGLKEREELIADSLNQAENAREEMAKLNANNEQLLQEARLERERILNEAREMKEGIVSEAKNSAKAEAEKILVSAKAEIETQKKAAITELKSQVGEMALMVAEKVIKKNLSNDSAQKDLVDSLVSEVKLN